MVTLSIFGTICLIVSVILAVYQDISRKNLWKELETKYKNYKGRLNNATYRI